MNNNKNLSKRIFSIALAFTILTYSSASITTLAANNKNTENTNYSSNIIYKQELKAQLDIANKENKTNYYRSENHWNKFEAVLKQSQEVYNDSNATQGQVNFATQNLKNAIFNLKNKYKLAISIDKANSLNASDYTSSSWFTLKTRLNEALQVYNNNSTIQEINNAEYYLNTAIKNLKKQANKQFLKEQIDKAKSLNKNDYTVESWANFEKILNHAISVYNSSNIYDQSVIDNAANNLKNAMAHSLISKDTVEKSDLKTQIDLAKSLNHENYTDTSWNVLKNALEQAENVYSNSNATQNQVDSATQNLKNAIQNLQSKPETPQVNKQELKSIIEHANTLNPNDYTNDSWATFKNALEQAENTYNNSNATQNQVDFATQNLKNAIQNLQSKPEAPQVNKQELKSIIEHANTLNPNDYTNDSWATFKNALEQAENIYNNSNATQNQVNSATQNLKNAIQNLQSKPHIPQSNKQELKNVIDFANTLNIDNYTYESWNKFYYQLKQAEDVYNSSNSTQSQINSATQNLKNSINSLISIVYKGYLEAEINKAETINKDNYIIDEAWVDFENKLNQAKNVLSNVHVSSYQVDTATNNLKNAIISLNEKAYKEYLKEAIDKANKLDSNDYTIESWTNLQNHLSKAIEIYNKSSSTQYEVDMAQMNLNNAIYSLQQNVNKDKLKNLIDQANSLNADDYTYYTWQNLEIALLEAVQVYNNPNEYEYEVYNATSMLENSIRQLEYKPNKDQLKNIIDFINNSNLNPNDYVESSWKKLEYQLEIASSIYNNPNATQYMIDIAKIDIQSALMNLEKKPNKDQLKNLIDYVSKLNHNDYTVESWRDLQIALDFGNSVYNDANSTQTDVDMASNYLQSEIDNLIRK